MSNKRSPWIKVTLGLMLFSLVLFSGLPLVNSMVKGNELSSLTNSVKAITPQMNDRLEAEAHGYQKVLLREPENETALRELLNIRLQQQDLDSAIAPLETLARIHPEQPQYGILLGQAKQYREDTEGAATAYNDVLANEPGNIMALGGLVNLFLNQDLPERAIALLQDTIDSATNTENIDLSSIQLLLGEVYTEAQKYPEAIALYDKIAQTDASDFRPLLAKALVLQEQGRAEEAQPLLKSAYELAPAQFKDQIKSEIDN